MPSRKKTYRPPSLNSGDVKAVKRDNQVYTGSSMKGIGTLHKSNAVPIFTDEEAQRSGKYEKIMLDISALYLYTNICKLNLWRLHEKH